MTAQLPKRAHTSGQIKMVNFMAWQLHLTKDIKKIKNRSTNVCGARGRVLESDGTGSGCDTEGCPRGRAGAAPARGAPTGPLTRHRIGITQMFPPPPPAAPQATLSSCMSRPTGTLATKGTADFCL